jgi:hypothetical protein
LNRYQAKVLEQRLARQQVGGSRPYLLHRPDLWNMGLLPVRQGNSMDLSSHPGLILA